MATAAIAFALLSKHMSGGQLLGFALMASGGFVMFLSEKLSMKKLLPPVLLAAGLLGLVNVLEKVVYDQTNFVSGYVWFTIGTFAGALALLVPGSWRKQIFAESGQDSPRKQVLVFRKPISFRCRIFSHFLCHQPDASGDCGRNLRRALCNYFSGRTAINQTEAYVA